MHVYSTYKDDKHAHGDGYNFENDNCEDDQQLP